MVISQPAVVVAGSCGAAVGQRLEGVRAGLRRLLPGRRPDPPADRGGSVEASAGPPWEPDGTAWVTGVESAAEPTLGVPAADARRARAAALRGVMLARKGRFDAAAAAFCEGLRLDPSLDLAGDPEVWGLTRGGLDAAVDAYERAGRAREAAALAARVRRRFTPRAVGRTGAKAGAPIPTQ